MFAADEPSAVLFFAIVIVCLASWCFPWRKIKTPAEWAEMQVPLIAFAIWGIYEWHMPPNMDIRLDMMLLGPVLIITAATYLIRMGLAVVRLFRPKRVQSAS